MNGDDLLRALKTVPPKTLQLVDLAWELVDEHGEMDIEKAMEKAMEVGLAEQEASAYVEATRRALSSLGNLVR